MAKLFLKLIQNQLSQILIVIFEVLSPSTAQYDFNSKLQEYKRIHSLEQIVFVDQIHVEVSVFTRTNQSNTWINHDFYDINDSILILDKDILLKDIYWKIEFDK